MSILSREEQLNLHAAIVTARLVESRRSLLSGIDPHFVAGLPRASTSSDQLLLDLDAMSRARILENGSTPLAIWLGNALALVGLLQEAAIFRAALEKCKGLPHPLPAPSIDAVRAVEVRLFNLIAAQEWTMTVTPPTTLNQLVGELRILLQARPWTAPGVPKPSSAYQFRFYRTEADAEPLSPHTTLAQLSMRDSAARLSLNVEWYRTFRGTSGPAFR